jgi:hypothetical protein
MNKVASSKPFVLNTIDKQETLQIRHKRNKRSTTYAWKNKKKAHIMPETKKKILLG